MALEASYKRFLAAPDPSFLAANASLHYITTTTSFYNPAEIIKHLSGLRKHVKKAKEETLAAIAGHDSLGLALELDTTLEFVISGGPYLPALDDNFVADRTVHLAVAHVVTFNHAGKIVQIRQSWDQGSLLKQLDVIGKSGRNWPIRDGADQIKLISKSVRAGADADPSQAASGGLPVRSRGNSTNALRDPHASLSLFAPRSELPPDPVPVVSPYAGVRPRQRNITDILGEPSEEEDEAASTVPSRDRERSVSPSKRSIAPKAGVSKTVQPVRLFEGVEDAPDSPENVKSPERFYRPNPKKYQHFDFADGSEPHDAPSAGTAFENVPKTKHNSQWSFDDFVTPQKPRGRPVRAQEVRHWGTENDDVAQMPAAKAAVPKPRRDAEPHFEFRDDGEPSGDPRPVRHPRGVGHNEGLGLYKNNLYSEDGGPVPTEGPDPAALGNITNLKDRRRDFDPQFGLTDESPQPGGSSSKTPGGNGLAKAVPEDRKKVVKMMEANWSAYDQSPASQKENNRPTGQPRQTGIAITGDGMGGKKGAGGRGWAIGDESDEDQPQKQRQQRRPISGKKQGEPAASQTGIVIAGDGMGGKKGAGGRGWSIGDESDEEQQPVQPRPVAGRKQGERVAAKAGGFWDF